MGRPGTLFIGADKINSQTINCWVAGSCVLVSEGKLFIPD
jgi:hypothetical protein